MSEVFFPFDWMSQCIADRLALAADVESGTSEAEVGLQQSSFLDEQVLGSAHDEPGLAIDPEAVSTLDPRPWVDHLPHKLARMADIGSLSGQSRQRNGRAGHAVATARVGAWQQRLHHLTDMPEHWALSCLSIRSEAPRGERLRRSSISTGMWQRA